MFINKLMRILALVFSAIHLYGFITTDNPLDILWCAAWAVNAIFWHVQIKKSNKEN